MAADPRVIVEREGAVARVRLARPRKRNAFDDAAAAELLQAFEGLADAADLRVVLLMGDGTVFCAGGDIGWMRRASEYSEDENAADALAFQKTFEAIDSCPHPVVARVQGAALGGGAGLVAAADIVVAADDAIFGFPEVRLGLVPGVISPFVLAKIGEAAARRVFLTGETFPAAEAQRLGLVHEVVEARDLDRAVAEMVEKLLQVSPEGARRAKALVRALTQAPDADAAAAVARRAIVEARASSDGREGTEAFLDKRPPRWRT